MNEITKKFVSEEQVKKMREEFPSFVNLSRTFEGKKIGLRTIEKSARVGVV